MKILKTLFFCVTITLFISCKYTGNNDKRVEYISKFKKGEIVYLKPDSVKAVIETVCPWDENKYIVIYTKNNEMTKMQIDEQLIYSKKW